MKKNVLSFLISFFAIYGLCAQSYSTGLQALPLTSGNDYSGKIDVTNTTVTLTLIGPSTGWMGMGFNATGMGSIGMDCVIFDGANMSDRRLNGVNIVPPLDAVQNWTVTSNTVDSDVRTVVATRARNTGDANDYVFPLAAQPINIIYARRIEDFTIQYHGSGSCNATTLNLTLGADDFVMESLKVYPNPSKEFFTVDLPDKVTKAEVKIYDAVGKLIKKQQISTIDNKIMTSDLTTGSYFMILRTEYGNTTRTLVID